jgi:DNA-binding NtrC family response regulator
VSKEPTVKAHILVVDDEDVICRTLTRLLRDQPLFDVRTVTDYQTALQVFWNDGPFDLLLTDLRLQNPGGGIELARQLLMIKPDLRVVLMSGDVPSEFAAKYRTIEKPFDRENLIQVLEETLLAPPHGELE